MEERIVTQRIANILLFVIPLVTVVATPWMSFDAVNVPKFAVLVVSALLILGLSLPVIRSMIMGNPKLAIFIALFVFSLFLSLFRHGFSSQQLYGSYGSNLGFLTFLSLATIFFFSARVKSKRFFKGILIALLVIGVFSTLYGLLQWRGLDPVKWVTQFGPIMGTLGNPNYFSSVLGVSSVSTFALAFGATKLFLRGVFLLLIAISQFLIVESESIQGLAIFLIGSIMFLSLRYFSKVNRIVRWILAVILAFCVTIIALSILGIGPLQRVFSQNSILARRFYWNAATEMLLARPLDGFGFDAYGENYRRYRSEKAAEVFGLDTVANSSHNYFLDIAVFGGLPLALSFLACLSLTVSSARKLLKTPNHFDLIGTGLVVCWLSLVAQALISPPQLGVAVWLWLLSGAVIGYETQVSDHVVVLKQQKGNSLPASAIITGIIGLSLGLGLALSLVTKDNHFREAVSAQDSKEILKAATRWPSTIFYQNYASELFLASKLNKESLVLAQVSIVFNPDNFVGWKLIWLNPDATATDKNKALNQMKRLDPYFKS